MDREPTSARAAFSILVTIALLVAVLVLLDQVLSTEMVAVIGLVMAGVAPKIVDLVYSVSPHLAGRSASVLEATRRRLPRVGATLRRAFPKLPAQAADIQVWSAVAAVFLLQGSDLSAELISMAMAPTEFGPARPLHPIWFLPLLMVRYGAIALAGYLIGRVDPTRSAKNLATAIYVYALVYLPLAIDPALQADFMATFGMGDAIDPRADGAVLEVTVYSLAEVAVRGGIAFYSALWGATYTSRHTLPEGAS